MLPTRPPSRLSPFLPSSAWRVMLLHISSVLGLASHFSAFQLPAVAMETFS